jgi:tetratricopeptide (TPR) repeat protein
MAKKRLNRKVALIGFVVFVFAGIAAIAAFLYLSRDPAKFLKDGDTSIASARQTTDKEQRKLLYADAESKYKKAYGRSKTDEAKVVASYRLTDVFIETGEWRDVLGCWANIIRLDSKDIKARYCRLKYMYIIAQTSPGAIWQEVAKQTSDLIDLIEKPGATPDLATTSISKWEIEALKQKDEPEHKLGPYMYLLRGRANLAVAQLGLVTNREETIKQAVLDLEKVKQLEPANPDIYSYLAQAAAFKGSLESSKGDPEASTRGEKEAISVLTEGIKNADNKVKANINLLTMKHAFSFAQASDVNADQTKQLLAMESEYLALVSNFSSNAESYAALTGFYGDYRLGPIYLDKAIEAIEKAMSLDNNNVDYALTASSLYSRRFNIRKQPADVAKTINITKAALSFPDAQEAVGPQSQVIKINQLRLHSMLAYCYIDQILDSTESQSESENQQLLINARQEVRQLEQLFGSGDDPQVIKWQGLVELAAAKIEKGDFAPIIRKLYKTYTQLKASGRSDPQLSYRLGKTFEYTAESGAVAEFLAAALTNGIEAAQPEARLDYAELILKVAMWKAALAHIDLFEERCGVTDRSRILRIRANIGSREFAEAEKHLEQLPQQNPSWKTLKMGLLESKCSQLRVIISRRAEKPQTGAVLLNTLTPKGPAADKEQRSAEQLMAEMKNALSAYIEYIDKLSPEDLNSLDNAAISSMCETAITAGQLDQAKPILDKFLKLQPDNTTAVFYKKLFAEPDPAKVSTERNMKIREESLAGITDPVRRAMSLGAFYQTSGEPNKAEEQFKKLAPPPIGTGELKTDTASLHRITGFLFDIAVEKNNWETVDKIIQIARQGNYDDCSGDFYAARAALAREQYESALASIDSALSQRPVFGYGYLLRSRINSGLGNEAAALTDMRTAASTNPLDRNIAKELAIRLYVRNQSLGKNASSSQLTETKSILDWAMALNPGDVQLISFYAEYISETEPDRAIALRQSLQENMPSVQNALLLARLALKVGLDSADTQRHQALLAMAESALLQAQKMAPQDPAVLDMLAKYYRDTGNPAKAEELLKGSNNSQLVWRNYMMTGEYDKARKILAEAYNANPKDEITLRGLVYLAEKTGDKASLTKYGDQLMSASETPDNHLLIIQTYLNAGLIKDAEQKLESFREKYPTDRKGLLLSSWLSMSKGNLKEAFELANKCLEGNQSDAIAWRLRGQINGMMTNYDQAIMDLKQSKVLLDDPSTRIALAKIYLKTGRVEDATIELKSVVEDPQAPDEARTMLEQIYSRAGKKEVMDDFYAKIIKQLPDNVYWLKRAAGFAGATGDFAKAEQLYETALKKSIEQGKADNDALGGYLRATLAAGKTDKLFEEAGKYIDGNLAPVAYFWMAEGKMKLGDRATAVQYCRKAVDKAGNNDALAVQVLQKVYALLGEQETEQLCQDKLKLQPDSFTANWVMYHMNRIKGDYSKALEFLDKSFKNISPDQPEWMTYMLQKAEVLILAFTKTSDKKYLKDAMDVYESLLKKTPNNTSILNNVAYILADNNQDLDKALEYAKRACEMRPDDPVYLDTYATVLYKMGKNTEALQYQLTSIQRYESQNGEAPIEAHENLGKIHEKLGNISKAKAAYEQAIESGGKDMQKDVKERINAAIERLAKSKGDENKGK